MNPPHLEYNRSPIENIGQTIDIFFRWLESEQTVISRYFDHHPVVRQSFLEAVQRVTGRESLVTPIATPVLNALNDDPTISASKEHDNLAVPAGIIDGTTSLFIANDEHLDMSFQEPVDECVEQARKDQHYPSNHPAASDDLEIVTHDLDSSFPYINSIQVCTVERPNVKRMRKSPADGETGVSVLSTLPRNILEKWNRIASPDDLAQLRLDICAKRRSPSKKKLESIPETSDCSDNSIEGQLTRYQLQYQRGINGTSQEYKKFTEVPWRLYLANIISLYMREKAARKKESRKRNRGRHIGNKRHKSVYDIFVDFLLPQLLKKDSDMREEANRRFDNWLQHGKRWAKLVECFGPGILLLIPSDLSNDNLRNLTLPEVDALVEFLDSYRPALKADIQNLAYLLSLLIEDRYLPDWRLKLEMLSESQITSGGLATQSLKELFKLSDDYSFFLTEAASSDLSRPSTQASLFSQVDLGNQPDVNMASPGPSIPGPSNPSITLYTDYLLSPTSWEEMDRNRDDFVSSSI